MSDPLPDMAGADISTPVQVHVCAVTVKGMTFQLLYHMLTNCIFKNNITADIIYIYIYI